MVSIIPRMGVKAVTIHAHKVPYEPHQEMYPWRYSLAMWSRRESGWGWWSCLHWFLAPGRSWSPGQGSQLRRRCRGARGRHWLDNALDRPEKRSCTHTAGDPADAQSHPDSSLRSLISPSYWETPAASAQKHQSTKPGTQISFILF